MIEEVVGVGSTPELDRGFVDQSRLVLYAVVLWRSRVILFLCVQGLFVLYFVEYDLNSLYVLLEGWSMEEG